MFQLLRFRTEELIHSWKTKLNFDHRWFGQNQSSLKLWDKATWIRQHLLNICSFIIGICWFIMCLNVTLLFFCFIFIKPARTLVHEMLVVFWLISVHRVTPHRSKTVFPEVKKDDTIIAVIYQNIWKFNSKKMNFKNIQTMSSSH